MHLGLEHPDATTSAVRRAAAHALRGHRVVLAVSGGVDSMVLLDAALASSAEIAAVATFDHGTGEAARRAAALVVATAEARGLVSESRRAETPLRGEAALRTARWSFLRSVAARHDAMIATGHTRDDQVETVLLRVLRGAGARGLAGLYARGDVLRPLVDTSREQVLAYARKAGVAWVDDPSNGSPQYVRNRLRRSLLPALAAVRPTLPDDLLEIARRAAALRADVDRLVELEVPFRVEHGTLVVAREHLARYDRPALALLWPAIAARAHIVLDRRGTERLASFTIECRPGSRIQLSGGYEALYHRGGFLLRGASARARAAESVATGVATEPGSLTDSRSLKGWRFRAVVREGDRLWSAPLPNDVALRVRSWRPGDRMVPEGETTPRRVKGLLRDAGVDAVARRGWPVVLAGTDIVWVPGVRRGNAATARSGRPVTLFACERLG